MGTPSRGGKGGGIVTGRSIYRPHGPPGEDSGGDIKQRASSITRVRVCSGHFRFPCVTCSAKCGIRGLLRGKTVEAVVEDGVGMARDSLAFSFLSLSTANRRHHGAGAGAQERRAISVARGKKGGYRRGKATKVQRYALGRGPGRAQRASLATAKV